MTMLRTLAVPTLSLACFGCPTEEKTVYAPTQVMLSVDTNPTLRSELTALRFSLALREGDTWVSNEADVTLPRDVLKRWPVDIPVLPRRREDEYKQFEVVVDALAGERVLAQTRRITRFLPGELGELELSIEACPEATASAVCAEEGCRGLACKVCASSGQCVEVEETKPKQVTRIDEIGEDRSDAGIQPGRNPDAGKDATVPPPDPTSDACRGKGASDVVCDGAVLTVCGADGATAGSETCMSARQCELGRAKQKCAPCLPGTYRCTGAVLELCGADGQSFGAKTTCTSAALCNAEAGACTTEACLPNSKICAGDTLRVCSPDQKGFVDEKACGPGLCDAVAKECDVCQPSTKSCDGKSVKTCNAQGQGFTTQPCPAATPACIGSGVCAQCATAAECPAPANACMEATCDAAGKCGTKPKAMRSPCSGGFCDGTGQCIGCFADPDCVPDKPFCSQGTCVRCRGNADCDTRNFQICDKGQCVLGPGCGNGRVDPGEDCEVFVARAPGQQRWDQGNCDAKTCKRKLYQNCFADSTICGNTGLCAGNMNYCLPPTLPCGDTAWNGCPSAPGFGVTCGDGVRNPDLKGICHLVCAKDADCPSDMYCMTDRGVCWGLPRSMPD